MRREYTVLFDNREKARFVFPATLTMLDDTSFPPRSTRTIRLRTAERTLRTADYILSESPNTGIIERKGSLSEVATNTQTTNGRRKFAAELERLFAWPRRCVLLEGDIHSLLSSPLHPALDSLQRMCFEHNTPLLLFQAKTPTQRQRLGEYIARWLINASIAGEHPDAAVLRPSPDPS